MKFTNERYVILVSYGNHLRGQGGTDKVILSHQRMFLEAGVSVLVLCPAPAISGFEPHKYGFFNVILDGKDRGILHVSELVRKLDAASEKGAELQRIYIHHLKGISLSSLSELLDRTECGIDFYIHDYYTVCCSHNLIDSDGSYCGDGSPSPEKCRNCGSADAAAAHYDSMRGFIMRYYERITPVAVSDSCGKVWLSAYGEFSGRIRVIYHQVLCGSYTGNRDPLCGPVRIAYVGYQSDVKGWQEWKHLLSREGNREEYRFFHLGRCSEKQDGVTYADVDFKKNNNAMIEALRSNSIDCAVLWSRCPETYSYTYYESYAANAFVVTTEDSGNIADRVRDNGNGMVLGSEAELLALFGDPDRLKSAISRFRENSPAGPERLVENPELIARLNAGEKGVGRIGKMRMGAGAVLKYPLTAAVKLKRLRADRKKG